MALEVRDEPSHVRLVLRELPRKKLLVVLLIVLLNLCVVTYLRGRAIGRERAYWLKIVRRSLSDNHAPRAADFVLIPKTDDGIDHLPVLGDTAHADQVSR
jgi:hypothetical protein